MKILTLFCIAFISLAATAQKAKGPYLLIDSKNALIPLRSTKADVKIAGKIAHVKITQTYQNLSYSPIEAQYVFPMSTQAAVHGMTMKVGDRVVEAKIFEKQQAKRIYEKAIKQGKRASKLDQKRPNVFQMKVGNILPKDEIVIDIYYTEMILPVKDEYQFVLPGVVGPRFVGESSESEDTFENTHTEKGIADTFEYDVTVAINAGVIIQNIHSKTHQIKVHNPDAESAEITLASTNVNPANRDFILSYDLRANKMQSGLLLYEGERENFFSLMIEPPNKETKTIVPPREYLFVVDVSGSMMGYPIEVTKSLMKNLLSDLNENDVFNILLFSADNKVFKNESVAISEETLKEAFLFLKGGNNYGGGTRLLNALDKAYELPRKFPSTARTMIVITDGYISVEKEAFERIGNNLDKANVITFGIGSSVNRYIIEGMARVGKSQSFIATSKTDAYQVAKDFKRYIESPLFTQVQLTANGFDMYDVEPKSVPDIFSDRPVLVFGKYKGSATGNIGITGYLGKRQVHHTIPLKHGKLSKQHEALKYLWAREKIKQLDDYAYQSNKNSKEELIALGLKYNLATKHTSFVAVDQVVVNKKGKVNNVNQPLPMPKNVENSAIGVEVEKVTKKYVKRRADYHISINSKDDQKTKRAIKIWLRGSLFAEITKLLRSYNQLRIQTNLRGEIVKIEKETNGLWSTDNQLKAFIKKLPHHLRVQHKTIITIQNNSTKKIHEPLKM